MFPAMLCRCGQRLTLLEKFVLAFLSSLRTEMEKIVFVSDTVLEELLLITFSPQIVYLLLTALMITCFQQCCLGVDGASDASKVVCTEYGFTRFPTPGAVDRKVSFHFIEMLSGLIESCSAKNWVVPVLAEI
jgi:hypothetical protein